MMTQYLLGGFAALMLMSMSHSVTAFVPTPKTKTRSPMTGTSSSFTALFYRNHSMATADLLTTVSPRKKKSNKLEDGETNNYRSLQKKQLKKHQLNPQDALKMYPSPPAEERREVNRPNLHPLFKLEMIPLNLNLPMLAAVLTVASPALLPWFPLFVLWRKARWSYLQDSWKEQHGPAFEQALQQYRKQQKVLVQRLIQERYSNSINNRRSKMPNVIAVTMATGQEGQGVVKALVAEALKQQDGNNNNSNNNNNNHHHHQRTILALCRNPTSAAAQALKALAPDIVQLVQCDSTDAQALRRALQPAQAVYLATTLNQANAGQWNMNWDGGDYQVNQGRAFCQAASGLPHLQQVIYGTAPTRKWPLSFGVEPPIHYAAKWRVEELLVEAGLPVTFLRKCPYHENFTKLTQIPQTEMAQMGVQGGAGFGGATRKVELPAGEYAIKAFTPNEFVYNMMDPRDAGQWAALCFEHAELLIGQSLSVASDALTGPEMAQKATDCGALGQEVNFSYKQQPRWLFESLAFVEPTFVYISGLQRWNCDGGQYDLDTEGVELLRELMPTTTTWCEHLEREGLGQFTETMADLLPDITKRF